MYEIYTDAEIEIFDKICCQQDKLGRELNKEELDSHFESLFGKRPELKYSTEEYKQDLKNFVDSFTKEADEIMR